MNGSMIRIITLVFLGTIGIPALMVAVDSTTTNATAPAVVAQKKLPKLLDLGATKCIPCKKMAPILEELKKEYAGKLEIEFIDVWDNPGAAKKHGITLIPTQIFYDASGKELFRNQGFIGKNDILAKWKALGINLAEAK